MPTGLLVMEMIRDSPRVFSRYLEPHDSHDKQKIDFENNGRICLWVRDRPMGQITPGFQIYPLVETSCSDPWSHAFAYDADIGQRGK